MRLSHKNKIQSKMSTGGKKGTNVTLVRSHELGPTRCCVGFFTAATLVAAVGSIYYDRKTYRVTMRAAKANRCKFLKPTTKKLCVADIVHTCEKEINGISCLVKVCSDGHENITKIIKDRSIHKFKKQD